MKNIFKLALSLLALASVSVSCLKDQEFSRNENNSEIGVFGDQIKMRLNVASSDPVQINTKAVNPDGKGVQSMTFFCFDENGLFLDMTDGVLHPDSNDNEKGQVDVAVPHNSRNIHIICNMNMKQVNKAEFKGKSESEVIQGFEAISGLLMYWAKIAIPENVEQTYTDVTDASKRTQAEAILDWITIQTNPSNVFHKGVAGAGNPIHLLRNQARITVSSEGATDEKGWQGTDFVITGYTVYNTQSYGTVAPYHTEFGYPAFGSAEFGVTQWSMEDYICLPAEDDYLNDMQDVSTVAESFVFESPNKADNPVEVIIKGYNIYNGVPTEEMYYKADIMDYEKGLLPVRRNHYYKFEILGNLYNGQETFMDAVEGPAANNIWVSVSDEVTAIQDGSFKLSVDKHLVILKHEDVEEDNTLELGFDVTKLSGIALNKDFLTVEWQDENQTVAADNFTVDFDVNTGKGTVNLQLNDPDGSKKVLEGVITVQYRQLFRRITVKVVPQFEFTPVYASSEGIQGQRDQVTLVYTVPADYPEELFPFNVLVTTNDLNIRTSSGQELTIVTINEEGYGDSFNDVVDGDNISDIGYKYIMQVTAPGEQRLYFETIEDEVLNNITVYVTLENENFKRHHEPVNLSNIEYEEYVTVKNMKEYISPGATGEAIKYLLVPQKRYAPVTFDLATEKIELVPNGEELVKEVVPVGVTSAEEFLLYSKNLDHYPDNDNRLPQEYVDQFDCTFVPFNESQWGRNGRVFGFSPRTDIASGQFEVYMETNSPKSAEVIFIVSNNTQSESIFGGANYAGQQFRSVTFELANYRPFRFAAQMNGQGEFINDASSNEEDITDIQLSYLESDVALSFDITSFEAADGASVDPFGTAFEIFIDAPTLKLGSNPAIESEMVTMFYKDADGNPVTESKKKLEDLGDGRFVYRVDADRAKEASFWTDAATITDSKAVSQNGERKTINFLTASQISAGNVTISANPDQVTYFSKTFRISNKPISGLIKYTDGEGNVDLPVGYSVSFYNKTTGQRIYSTVISEAGKFDLYLSNNRPVDIEKDPVIVSVQIGGNYYEAEIPYVKDLFVNNTVTFIKK